MCSRSAYLAVLSFPVTGKAPTEIVFSTLSKSTGKVVHSFSKAFGAPYLLQPFRVAIVP